MKDKLKGRVWISPGPLGGKGYWLTFQAVRMLTSKCPLGNEGELTTMQRVRDYESPAP